MDLDRIVTQNNRPSLWGRAAQVSREEGLQGIARRIKARASRIMWIERNYMLACPLEQLYLAPTAQMPLEITVVSPADGETIRELVRVYGVRTSEVDLLDRLAQKELCYIGRVDGRIVAYLWVLYAGDVREYNQTLYHLRPHEIYFHDAWTVPEQRGKNICPAISTVIGRDMAAQRDKRRIVKYVKPENTASLNVSRKFRELHIGWVGWVKCLGRRMPFYIPIRPRPLR